MMGTGEELIDVRALFGFIELRPWNWVTDADGRRGQQYLRIDYAQDGTEISRKLCEPVCWLSYN